MDVARRSKRSRHLVGTALALLKPVILLAFVEPAIGTAAFLKSTLALRHDDNEMTQSSATAWLLENADSRQPAQSAEYLSRNSYYAVKARHEIPVAGSVPDDLFHKYVLPYRNVDEPVDDWREGFFKVLSPHAKQATSLKDAVETVVPLIFTDLRNSPEVMSQPNSTPVVFKSNSTPEVMAPVSETLRKGYASCTGTSILIVNGLRSVGIPARVVGTPEWNIETKGNHNWVEVWTGDGWHFFDAAPTVTLDKAWFVPGNTKHAAEDAMHRIYSAEWAAGDVQYPLTWREPAVMWRATDRTSFYLDKSKK